MTSFGSIAARDERVRRFHRERDARLVEVTFHVAGDICRATADGSLDVVDVEVLAGGE
ncbi:MAG: hypothetical protein V5A38_13255 [Halolamina sp.]|uniref:hypothetical protein n=1 Tax=Halolamina sp. TaxID=1940283 RepID=UPI002FC3135F